MNNASLMYHTLQTLAHKYAKSIPQENYNLISQEIRMIFRLNDKIALGTQVDKLLFDIFCQSSTRELVSHAGVHTYIDSFIDDIITISDDDTFFIYIDIFTENDHFKTKKS